MRGAKSMENFVKAISLSLILILLIGIAPSSAQSLTATSTTSPSQSTQNPSAESSNIQTIVESLNSTFTAVINELKNKGYNTTELEQTVSEMLQAISEGNFALGRALFIRAVNNIYSLEVGNATQLRIMEQQRLQQDILERIQDLNQSISNMTFLSQDVRSNLTQLLSEAAQQAQSGNYSAASQLMEKVMVQLRDMTNALNRERVRAMLTTMAIERADKLSNLTGKPFIDEEKLINDSDVKDLALKVRGLGLIEREMRGAVENMNISWMWNTSDEDILKGKLGDIVEGKAKGLTGDFFAQPLLLLQIAEESLNRNGKMAAQLQDYIQELNSTIVQEKQIINDSVNAVSKLMSGDSSSIEALNQNLNSAQQLLSQLEAMKVPPQLQNVRQLLMNSLEWLIRDLNLVLAMQQGLASWGKSVLLKGIIVGIEGNNLTVLAAISPGSLIMPMGAAHSMVLIPTNWTVVMGNFTEISGDLTLYAPVLVHGTIADYMNHVVTANKVLTINSTITEEQENGNISD